MPTALSGFKRRVNKEVAHLTYDRIAITHEHKKWKIKPYIEISRLVEKFLKCVDNEKLGPSWVKFPFTDEIKCEAMFQQQSFIHALATISMMDVKNVINLSEAKKL